MARTDRPAANDTDRIMIGTRFAMTSNESRTVHAVPSKHATTALCGATVRFSTYGEEKRMPLCARCTKRAQAEFDKWDADEEDDPAQRVA